MLPSEFLRLDRRDKAFIVASIQIKEKKRSKEINDLKNETK